MKLIKLLAIHLAIVLASLLAIPGNAAIRYLTSDSSYTQAYHSPQTVHDASNSGDTIYVIGGSTSNTFGSLTTSRRLTWIGPGYYLNRPGTQASPNTGSFWGVITINPGSQGSVFMGLTIWGGVYHEPGSINCDSITFRRCYLGQTRYDYASDTLHIRGNRVTIEQCVISHKVWVYPEYNEFTFRNNVMNWYDTWLDIETASGFNAVYNNVIWAASLIRSEVFNNIFYHTSSTPPEPTFYLCSAYNNVGVPTLPAGNGNISNVIYTSIFVNTGSDDSWWQLSTSSPARNAGVGGADCGAFGGTAPYVLSGMPPIPSISAVSLPGIGSPSSGLQMTIQAVAHP